MDDLTIIYYTSNKANVIFTRNVRNHLLRITNNEIPIISVSQLPIDFGKNICVGNIGASIYNVYRQIFEGLKETKTDFVACAEDDSLYNAEHFAYRPPLDTVAYNMNRWHMDDKRFFYRERVSMLTCMAPTEYLYNILRMRFEKFPDGSIFDSLPEIQRKALTEPGRYERYIGMPEVNLHRFKTVLPVLTMSHRSGLGGRRKPTSKDPVTESLFPWGNASELWRNMNG